MHSNVAIATLAFERTQTPKDVYLTMRHGTPHQADISFIYSAVFADVLQRNTQLKIDLISCCAAALDFASLRQYETLIHRTIPKYTKNTESRIKHTKHNSLGVW